MSKVTQPRRLQETEAKASLQGVKGSPQKAGLVLDLIRGKAVDQALAELAFCRKGLAEPTRKLLLSAVANAENNHDLNVDKLFVKEAYADKGMVLKRWRARARGRVGRILKPRCHITLVVAERAEQAKPATKTKKAPAKKAETKKEAQA